METDELIPLSYISQYNYCKRRVGLLMLEQQWSDSTDTVKGTAEHKNVHTVGIEYRDGKYILTEHEVYSRKMGLIGKCDAIESSPCDDGVFLPFLDNGLYCLYPIEYKHGRIRAEAEYELQLCAQAMCLEEMYSAKISAGAVFYINSHRRKEVHFNEEMRCTVVNTAKHLSEMLEMKQVPKPESSPKCYRCSLKDICMPDISSSVSEYMKGIRKEIRRGD